MSDSRIIEILKAFEVFEVRKIARLLDTQYIGSQEYFIPRKNFELFGAEFDMSTVSVKQPSFLTSPKLMLAMVIGKYHLLLHNCGVQLLPHNPSHLELHCPLCRDLDFFQSLPGCS